MASEGPNSGGTFANDNTVGTVTWSNPSNAAASDNSYASIAGLVVSAVTEYLKATNFGFSIPGGSTIDGIEVGVERKDAFLGGGLEDSSVKVVKSGSVVGDDKAAAGDWPTSDTYATYGNSSELWGASWSASDINDTGFGFAISAVNNHPSNSRRPNVDHIRITVYYTEGGGNNVPEKMKQYRQLRVA